MLFRLPRRLRNPPRLLGLLAAFVALVSQLALGSVVLPSDLPQTELAVLDAASIFCQTGAADGGSDRAPVPHRAPDYALCPLAVSLAMPAVIPTAAPVLPRPGDGMTLRPGALPQARAPPAHDFAAAYPRGPPRLV